MLKIISINYNLISRNRERGVEREEEGEEKYLLRSILFPQKHYVVVQLSYKVHFASFH
jgi:hypothetical protein